MSMNYRSAKKRGMTKSGGKRIQTLGSCMGQGTGAKGGFTYQTMRAAMDQGDNKRSFSKAKNKLGVAMNQ